MCSTALHNNTGLTIPSTQNTAPILDFRCLYTHDLRRKAKRWQDGTLRFHTFNKRIMVYDLSKNFIGDHHWCEKDPLQDGDELELDKGVLIQVGDSIGTTVQDISGLFEKRKKTRPDTPGGPVNTTRLLPVQLSQLRPKSLNALLGTPKGPLGRATVPFKSPCQLRLEDENARTEEERSVKRQRVETQPEKAVLAVKLPKKRSAGSDKAAIINRLPSIRPTISDSSSTEQPIVGSGRRPITEKTLTTNSETAFPTKPKKVISKTEVKLNPGFNQDDSSEIDGTSKRNTPSNSALESSKSSRPRCDRVARPLNTTNFSEKREKPQLPDAERVNQLQIIARKPRRKLLYKDLLPQSANSSKPPTNEPGSTRKSIEAGCRGPRADTQAKRHQAESGRLKARSQRMDEKEENLLHSMGDLGQISPAGCEFDPLTWIPSSLEKTTKEPQDTTQLRPKIPTEYLPNPPNHTSSNRNHFILPNNPSWPPIKRPSIIPEPTILIPNSPPQAMRSKPSDSSNRSPLRKINSAKRAPVPVLMQDQKPDPWSREAWDIFGHGRPEKKNDL